MSGTWERQPRAQLACVLVVMADEIKFPARGFDAEARRWDFSGKIHQLKVAPYLVLYLSCVDVLDPRTRPLAATDLPVLHNLHENIERRLSPSTLSNVICGPFSTLW